MLASCNLHLPCLGSNVPPASAVVAFLLLSELYHLLSLVGPCHIPFPQCLLGFHQLPPVGIVLSVVVPPKNPEPVVLVSVTWAQGQEHVLLAVQLCMDALVATGAVLASSRPCCTGLCSFRKGDGGRTPNI